ncbi:MAG: hypothetical protein KF901_29275 [Myxococcales bacterium]|nr:hypothetical protein [Myxococcales bacterium]
MRALTSSFSALLVVGCVATEVGSVSQPVTAYCEGEVRGVGVLDIENDYLPRVVNCENGGAAFEALKAQAVAARTYLYYKLDTSGSIADGTNDQVYGCSRTPQEQHYEAVRQTSGQVLRYAGRTIAGFYVAGARNQPPPECRGSTDDPTNTERYVTYNEGRSGDDLIQTTLGWVNPGNTANRGCMSQNGSHCLAGNGWSHEDILRFYYGADIEITRAVGACVEAPEPTEDAGSLDRDAGFEPGSDAALEPGGDAGDAGVAEDLRDGRLTSSGCSATGGATPSGLALVAVLALRRRRP